MTAGLRRALVLLHPPVDPEMVNGAFDQWLHTAGWDPIRQHLRPPADHGTLGWKACAVDGCDRPAWGPHNGGLCDRCRRRWQDNGEPDRSLFDHQPRRRSKNDHPPNCRVAKDGKRCGRLARNRGICNGHSWAVEGKTDVEAAIAGLTPLPSLGKCRVASCDRDAETTETQLCSAHANRWRGTQRNDPHAALEDWSRREKPVRDARLVAFGGLDPRVVRQILFGVFGRSRRGSRTRVGFVQTIVDWARSAQISSLSELSDTDPPAQWSPAIKSLFKTIMITVEYGDLGPDDFRLRDFWPGTVFGKSGCVDFRDISQPWLRAVTRDWCWDNLNRLGDFASFSCVAREIDYFSEYLRANIAGGGDDLQRLDRSAVTGFAAYLAALVETGAVRHRDRRTTRQQPAAWNKALQWNCLLMVQRILRYGRDTGRMDQIPGSFVVTDDLLIRRPRPNADDDTGEALPTEVLKQLFSNDSLEALRTCHSQMPAVLRLVAETGRRPTEVLSLTYDCIDAASTGGPYLIYTENKVTAGEVRKLPVLSVVVDVVREQQKSVRRRYPSTPISDLRLFPRTTMNPNGSHAIASWTLSKYLAKWVQALPRLDSSDIGDDGQARPFDRSLIFPYAFRHTYAQRHADAGTSPDVLMELMGHEKISTTMGYYRIPQRRRREAAEIVGNIVITGDGLLLGRMSRAHRLADERSTVAVPFGKCSNPQNVAAEGHGCPIRHQCFGCASFSSDPSYLPEMRRRLLDLKAIRARVDAFEGATDWAKRDARPSDEELHTLDRLIRAEEDKLDRATPEQRGLIDEASRTLRKARAASQVELTLRRPNGEDALSIGHVDDGRNVVDALGCLIDD